MESRRNISWDVLKALMLALMCFDHLCPLFAVFRGTCSAIAWPFGSFSMAEGFVFMAGLASARAYAPMLEAPGDWPRFVKKIHRRTGKLYLVHLSMAALLGAVVLWRPEFFVDAPYVAMQIDPVRSWVRIALMAYAPPLLDILPLYIFLLPLTPYVLRAFRNGAVKRVLTISFGGWIACQLLPDISWLKGTFFSSFSLFAWQFLFVLGLFFGSRSRPSWMDRGWSSAILLAGCAAIAASMFVLRHGLIPGFWPNEWIVETFLARRVLAPGVLLSFLAFCELLHRALCHRVAKAAPRLQGLIASVGRHTLWIFWWNALAFSLGRAFLVSLNHPSIMMNALFLSGLLISHLIPVGVITAMKSRKRRRRPPNDASHDKSSAAIPAVHDRAS